jgi:uncharacterized protein YeaO (DUF488 family)
MQRLRRRRWPPDCSDWLSTPGNELARNSAPGTVRGHSANEVSRLIFLPLDQFDELAIQEPKTLRGEDCSRSRGEEAFTTAMPASSIRLKRVYEPAAAGDGLRILVERLWPRGLRKGDAALDHRSKDLAPSAALRTLYGHRPARWEEFRRRYLQELEENQVALNRLMDLCSARDVTFVFAARDERRNSAVLLKEYMEKRP